MLRIVAAVLLATTVLGGQAWARGAGGGAGGGGVGFGGTAYGMSGPYADPNLRPVFQPWTGYWNYATEQSANGTHRRHRHGHGHAVSNH